MKAGHAFSGFAKATSKATGHPLAFFAALAVIIVWCATGPVFHYSDTWQLVINTSTTIVTFLMVFLIQHSQNHDTASIQVKLDELIRALGAAQDSMLDLEDLDDRELQKLRDTYIRMAKQARAVKAAGVEPGTSSGV